MEPRSPSNRLPALKPCWKCASQAPGLPFCGACGSLQDFPFGTSHFAVMGLAESLDLDAEKLRERFYELSKQLHPDRFARASAQEKAFATRWSTAVNRAYRALKDTEERALYLLELAGRDPNRGKSGIPIDLAETYFELQDALGEPGGEARLQGFRDEIASQQSKHHAAWATLARAWRGQESPEVRKRRLDELEQHLIRGRYLQSMFSDIERKLGGSGDSRH